MNYLRGGRCYQCQQEWDLQQDTGYVCRSCQGNLELLYDYERLKRDCRREYFAGNPDLSIWRYAPLLPVENKGQLGLHIGMTPLYPLKTSSGVKLYLKDEGRNPSASLKDRASAIALLHAQTSGASKIVAASTGNAGSSMACLAANAGIPAVIFVPQKAPKAKLAQLAIFGAKLVMVTGNYDDAFNLCLEVSQEFGWYNRNTGYNPYTREGKKTCAFEICEQLHWQVADWVVVPVGDGNIISALGKGFRELQEIGLIDRVPRLAAVQSTLSNAIARSLQRANITGQIEIEAIKAETIADSISVDLPRDGIAAVKAILESQGIAIEVSDEEILAAMAQCARQWGVFAEPAAAATIAGFTRMQQMDICHPDETVVCVITGNGLKDVAAAIKAAPPPVIIEPTLRAAKKVL